MNNFKDIQSIWNSQDDNDFTGIPEKLIKRIKKADQIVNDSHVKTIIILLLTMLLVGASYVFFLKFSYTLSEIGLGLMLLALAVRILLEGVSYKKKKQLDVLRQSDEFVKDLVVYYNWRKKMHKYPTLLTLAAYIIGVALLFVEFKDALSQFWFNFFIVEFIVIAAVLFIVIRKKIIKEINSIHELIVLYKGE